MEFSLNLKKLREGKCLSQAALANKIEVSTGLIGMYESGKRMPSKENLESLADFFNVSIDFLLGREDMTIRFVPKEEVFNGNTFVSVPIMGTIPAGVPLEAIQDIIGYTSMKKNNGDEYFALEINGDSMYPEYKTGDIVIFRKQEDCDSGQCCAVYVNGYDATFKKVMKQENGVLLQPINISKYESKFYPTKSDTDIKILGVAVKIERNL